MKAIQKIIIFTPVAMLVVLLLYLWFFLDYESQDGIHISIIITVLVIGNISLFHNLGKASGCGDYLLMENIKKGTCFKVISSLEIPNKKPHCFYVIELQNGNFSILSLEYEKKWEDSGRVLQAGKSYYVDTTKGSLVMV